MKKVLLFSLMVLLLISYVSIQAVNSISSPAICTGCHYPKHMSDPEYLAHAYETINCIDCHSGSGISGYVEARKEMTEAILLKSSRPALSYIFQNSSYQIRFVHLQPDCAKCHFQVKGRLFDHSNSANCIECHTMNGTQEKYEKVFLEKMGMGGHRNKTCRDCHSTDFQRSSCTDCHKAHKEGMNRDNSICLACHDSPHVPIRDGKFSEGIAKENCGACHSKVYEKLNFYNSKHNQLSSCVSCHPAHKEKKKCFDCHVKGHLSHPFAENNCGSCHAKAACEDCHKEPHAPLKSLPRMSTIEQFNSYAETIKDY